MTRLAGPLLAALLTGCATHHLAIATATKDLPAFMQVEDGFYRGGQPTPEGMRELSRMGVRTIISLRHPGEYLQWERGLAQELGMQWVNLPMWYLWRPSKAQIRQFLEITSNPANRPVFVHCRQGRNRAGVMIAIYRVAKQGWTPERAYAEGHEIGMMSWNPFTRHLLFHEIPTAVRSETLTP